MPLVSRTFDQLIDFTRTSSATFVGSNGLIQSTLQSRNLLTFTQEFDNAAWSKLNATATANSTTAPDGTSTADTFQATATTGAHNLQQSGGGSGAPLTLSVYAKAGTHSFLQLSQGSASGIFANFNLSTGALGTVGASATATITSAGNGWYRCALTFTPASAANMRIGMVTSGTAVYTESWTAAGTETIFLWGAQLELASTATDYTRNFGGLFPPRFDYDPVTLAPRGLLLEEQRTNLLTYSEQFDNAAWAKATVTVTADATTSPDGTVDADTITNTALGGRVTQFSTAGATASHTYSVYVKAGVATLVTLLLRNNTSATNIASVTFNIAAGTISSTAAGTGSITNAGNGWYRCVVTSSGGVTAADTLVSYVYPGGTAGASSDSVSVWGAQLEAGAFATSYIPTVASQVTRTADTPLIQAPNFAPWYAGPQGTFVCEFTANPAVSSRALWLADNSAGRILDLYISGIAANRVDVYSNHTTSGLYGLGTFPTPNTIIKVAATMGENDSAAVANGGAVVVDNTTGVPLTATRLVIGQYNLTSYLNGHIRSIRYYPVRLSNAQLQALTA